MVSPVPFRQPSMHLCGFGHWLMHSVASVISFPSFRDVLGGFGDSPRATEDRERWKGIVATTYVVPRRPPRLRDWDGMRWLSSFTIRILFNTLSSQIPVRGGVANHWTSPTTVNVTQSVPAMVIVVLIILQCVLLVRETILAEVLVVRMHYYEKTRNCRGHWKYIFISSKSVIRLFLKDR